MSSGHKFKVKLASGRILGPIDLERIRLLILKNRIAGTELAREYPKGEWVKINSIRPIADLLVAHAQGKLKSEATEVVPTGTRPYIVPGTTRVIPEPEPAAPPATEKIEIEIETEEERTVIASLEPTGPGRDKTVVLERLSTEDSSLTMAANPQKHLLPADLREEGSPLPIAEQRTIMLSQPLGADKWKLADAVKDPRKIPFFLKNKARDFKSGVRNLLAILCVLYIALELLIPDAPGPAPADKWVPIRPALPVFGQVKADPKKSVQIYNEAMKYYIQDTVPGYKIAVDKLNAAVNYDNGNVKALAILASSYLNLIDSSNKDEKYFEVISKLIELSRAKNIDLAETVIADVEFYITVNKAEAAENRIVEYTKTHQNYDAAMFYYLALAFYNRGDNQRAETYISQYPESRAFSPKIFYLRGQIAEKFGDDESAIKEYEKAVRFYQYHAKSHLNISRILARKNRLQEAQPHLEFLARHPVLLDPRDLAYAYFLHAKLLELHKQTDIALADMERAVRLDPDNHDYLLALYTLRASTGGNLAKIKPNARMYYFLGEGEKLLKEGNYQDALTQFLQAREANDKSPLPLIKIGDMFTHLHDLANARLNYKMAADRAPNSIQVWSKYIDVLIQSYEWDDAKAAMDRFRRLPVSQSAIDKAAADMYAKQGLYEQAQVFYRKAMARDTIDSSVYIAYAKTLMATKNYRSAPFFFALALRFDPLNTDAIVGTAKCIAATEGIDRAISMLQDELQKGTTARAELLAAIAEFMIQKEDRKGAQEYINQAMAADPEYAYPWRLQAQIYMNNESQSGYLDKALEAYNSYSDRNNSDPSGYLERYRIFVKKGQFDKASDELGKIFAIYPKYPNLHFYKGALYSIMGNHKTAIEEFKVELANNPNSVATLISLGREYIKLDAPADALVFFNRALQLAPKSAEPKMESGYANYLLKNYAGAIALYRAASQYDKGNPELYKRMGMTYQEMGDSASAAEAFRQYLTMEPDAPDKDQYLPYLNR